SYILLVLLRLASTVISLLFSYTTLFRSSFIYYISTIILINKHQSYIQIPTHTHTHTHIHKLTFIKMAASADLCEITQTSPGLKAAKLGVKLLYKSIDKLAKIATFGLNDLDELITILNHYTDDSESKHNDIKDCNNRSIKLISRNHEVLVNFREMAMLHFNIIEANLAQIQKVNNLILDQLKQPILSMIKQFLDYFEHS